MMTSSLKTLSERLRGALPAEGLGARGLERIARNPSCSRLLALAGAAISSSTAATQIYGEPIPDKRSPLALAQGNRFEHQVFKDDAARLIELYQKKGRLLADPVVVSIKDLPRSQRKAASKDLLLKRVTNVPGTPDVILQPLFEFELVGHRHTIEPDALVAVGSTYQIVEVKSYTDRGGRTDAASICGACRQMAVGVMAVRQTLERIGISGAVIPEHGDLILKAPGSMYPTLRPMSLTGEISSLERMLAGLPGRLKAIVAELAPGENLQDPAVLDRLKNNLLDNCREFCTLAPICKRQALACGSLSVMGSAMAEALLPAGNLERVFELMDGASPTTAEEATLALALQQAQHTLETHCEY